MEMGPMPLTGPTFAFDNYAAILRNMSTSDAYMSAGIDLFKVPEKMVVITCGEGAVVCPGVNVERPQRDFYYLIKHTPDAADPENVVPEMSGADLNLEGSPDHDRRGEPPRGEARRSRPPAAALSARRKTRNGACRRCPGS